MRWRLRCDSCGFEAQVGPAPGEITGWGEACQLRVPVGGAAACTGCGGAPSLERFRFEELYGELQHAAAVLSAWAGDPAPLAALLPDRPRFLTDLGPPELEDGDDGPERVALQALVEGRFREARELLSAL